MAKETDPGQAGEAREAITCEKARRAGVADGEKTAYFKIFIEDPAFEPPAVRCIFEQFEIQQSELLNERAKALGLIEQQAQGALVTLSRQVSEVQAISAGLNPDILALERAGAPHRGESWDEVRFLTPEEAVRMRLEQKIRKHNADIEGHVTLLTTADSNWLQTWWRYKEEARKALHAAETLVICYRDGLLSTHENAGEIARRWRPRRFELLDDWFEDPQARLRAAMPRGVRDSADQAWEQWLDLWRRDMNPRSIESGDHNHHPDR
ncbi:hypothetical protein OG320_06195 [Microbispora sp. NBC_01189]|uniref:hypothetical protein n=1 Tax=Microbispora sp. NBC_01189 TaxID=2903583 RepID=UPI002E0D76A4|nr:hypothetical protein OG320_06195 [Microbispora sp. NBC_01189]